MCKTVSAMLTEELFRKIAESASRVQNEGILEKYVLAAKEEAASASLKGDLTTKVKALFANSGNLSQSPTLIDHVTRLFNGQLSDADKLDLAILNYRDDNQTASSASAQVIEEYYGKMFDPATIKHQSNTSSSACVGKYTYSAANQTYTFDSWGCGGTLLPSDVAYIYDATTLGDKAYVYLAAGSYDFKENNGIPACAYYNDIYSRGTKLGTCDSSGFSIDESNYNDFTKYRFTFEKSADGDYYFTGSEKI